MTVEALWPSYGEITRQTAVSIAGSMGSRIPYYSKASQRLERSKWRWGAVRVLGEANGCNVDKGDRNLLSLAAVADIYLDIRVGVMA
jgi:hypothetical protein